jgi:hypothetical protein
MLIPILGLFLAQCPDLSGQYLCEDDGETVELLISQDSQGYFYQEGNEPGQKIIPDGRWYEWNSSDYVREAKAQAECIDGKKLSLTIDGTLYQNNKPTHHITYISTYKKSGGNLSISSRFIGSEDETLYFCKAK